MRVNHREVAEELPSAISTVLNEPVFELNANRLRMEIEAMPPAAVVVQLIEHLAEDRPPLLNR